MSTLRREKLTAEELERLQPGILEIYDLLVRGDTATEKVSGADSFYVSRTNRSHYLSVSLPVYY